jgi:Ni,Fe-hydrogenase III small subunit
VSAGGSNERELDTNVLNTVGWDLGRFGVQFVASPRHADGVLITGAVSQNMKLALQKTLRCDPRTEDRHRRGDLRHRSGPFVGHAEVNDGATDLLPIDLLITGCPPDPLTIPDGILRLLGRVGGGKPRPGPANEQPGQ